MASPQDARSALWVENLRDERDGVALYEGLARVDTDPVRAQEFQRLAEAEARHAAIWQRKLENAGLPLPEAPPSARVRVLLWLARRLGTRAVLPLVLQVESSDVLRYVKQGTAETAALVAEEQAHGDTLRQMSGTPVSGPAARITEREGLHRVGRGGTLRAAVFGMNDGLVSNLALVLGVAAAGAEHAALLVTGLAGLLAGAFSMAVGEYVSMASQRDLLRRQIELERRELIEAPEEEEAELAQLLLGKGLSKEHAEATAHQLMQNPEAALDMLIREELGLNPADLGSPIRAALSSFFTFSAGALVPLAPLLFLSGTAAAVTSALLSGAVLATVGALLGFLAGTNPLRTALRMVLLAGLAAAITIGVGRLVGTALD